MKPSNILFIVEGKRAEPTFLKVLWNNFYPETEYEVYSYNTNLSVLAAEYFQEGHFDQDLDLIKLLKEKGTDHDNQGILDSMFSDIYLIFDLDPQSSTFKPEKISTLMNHFNDSAGNGKLYLSYPMLESWKDIISMDDPEFRERYIDKKDILRYKQIVNRNGYCWDRLRSYSKTDKEVFKNVILHHMKKSIWIQNGMIADLTLESYYSIDLVEICQILLKYLAEYDIIYTLCTPLFLVVEYNPTKFFDELLTINTISNTTMPD